MNDIEELVTREIKELHDFFARWFRGDMDIAGLARMEQVLADGFLLVSTEGSILDRAMIIESVRGQQAARAYEISTRNERVLWRFPPVTLAVYEEWQDGIGRQSTVLFRDDPERPNGLLWLHLHETAFPVVQ